MQVKRFLENKLAEDIGRCPAVVLVGPRQVGKTTLAKTLRQILPKPTEYLDLELPSDARKLREPEVFLQRLEGATVILDEIQRMPELFPLLRALIDQRREPGRFVLLSSASPELLLKSAEPLAGRVAFWELSPILLAELEAAIPQETHWFRGGFPEALLAPDDAAALDWLHNFLRSTVERDLPLLGFPGNKILAESTLKMLASVHSNLLNYSTLADSMGISVSTVRRYVDFFEQAFLIRRLEAFHYRIAKRVVKAPKIFIRDSGLFHALMDFDAPGKLFAHVALGASWEGYVVEQIVHALRPGIRPYFYRTADGAELDLVLANGVEAVATFEVKFSNSPSLSKGNFLAIDDVKAPYNFVVTPGSDHYPLKPHIETLGVAALQKVLREIGVSRLGG